MCNETCQVKPLHQGKVSELMLILKKGLIDANEKCLRNQWALLHFAAKLGYYDVAKLLLEKGADIEATTPTGQTALHLAADNGHSDIVEILLENGATIDAKNPNGYTPLLVAVDRYHRNVVEVLLNRGADISVINRCKETLLHVAARSDDVDIVKLLLNRATHIESKNYLCWTPLFVACNSGFGDIVEVLLEAGAQIDLCDVDMNTPLHLAAERSCHKAVKLLLDRGAKINARNNHGWSPLFFAIYHFLEDTSTIELLLDGGADLTIPDFHGTTPLHIAARKRFAPAAKLLIDKGAELDTTNQEGLDVVSLAFKYKGKHYSTFLIKNAFLVSVERSKPDFYWGDTLSKVWDSCKSEVELMQRTMIGNSKVSFYSLLREVKERKVIAYLCNESILSELNTEKYKSMFPIYENEFTSKITDLKRKKNVLLQADGCLSCLIPVLPAGPRREIIKYLTDLDLKSIIETVNNVR